MTLGDSSKLVPKLFNKPKELIYRKPFVPVGKMVTPVFAGLAPQARRGLMTTDVYKGRTTICAHSMDCPPGFYCNNLVCTEIGGGNSGTGSFTPEPGVTGTATGCCTNANKGDCGPYSGGSSCGGGSGTGQGCYAPGCGQGSSGGGGGTGKQCCREDANGEVKCTCSGRECPPEPSCSEYCTSERDSFGNTGAGCDSGNTCSECSYCNNGSCIEKAAADRPCHCRNDCQEQTCCSFQDTCKGRIDKPYCHLTYRTGVPRCYNPDVTCDPGSPECLESRNCTSGSGSSVPAGCSNRGFITNDDTGETVYIYECCDISEKSGCTKCSDDAGCGECQYCDKDLGECKPQNNCTPVPRDTSQTMYVRVTIVMWGDGWAGPPEKKARRTPWVALPPGGWVGTAPNDLTEAACLDSVWAPRTGYPSKGAMIKKDPGGYFGAPGCVSSTSFNPLGIYGWADPAFSDLTGDNGVYVAGIGGGVGIDGYVPYPTYYQLWFEASYEFSFDGGITSSPMLPSDPPDNWPDDPASTLPGYTDPFDEILGFD